MKIYTKTGDKGQTSLVGGQRVPKDDARIEAYGTIDELNAQLGLVISRLTDQELQEVLIKIQNHLLDIGSELASLSDRKTVGMQIPTVTATKVAWLEEQIDHFDAELEPLKNFILPGGEESASLLHIARTVCRRAERRIVSLSDLANSAAELTVNPELIRYVNRLSDLLFTLARVANRRAGTADVAWTKDSP